MEVQCNMQWKNLNNPDTRFLNDVIRITMKHRRESRPFFVGLCYYCKELGGPERMLLRCSGCQLVAYCSRDCQKEDRSTHKHVCKEFPVVKGKNVLQAKGSWNKHIGSLRERAARLPNAEIVAEPIFRNPRVCHMCREADSHRLTDCECLCVSYCSKNCANADKNHKKDCSYLKNIAGMYCMWDEPRVTMMDGSTTCEKFTPVSKWSDFSSTKDCVNCSSCISCVQYCSATERASSAMTLLYALQKLPGPLGILGNDNSSSSLEDLTSLTVHVVTSSPLFHADPWEILLHRLPNLKQLNVVFLMQDKGFKDSFLLNDSMSLKRCEECTVKNRIITYSVQEKLYHMFFSSLEYTEPDVVVVYGNKQEMSMASEEDVIHSRISYRNMLYSRDTVLVLTDVTKDLVKQGIKAVSDAQPVVQLVAPKINPLRGFSSNRAHIDSENVTINDKHYFTCLRRK